MGSRERVVVVGAGVGGLVAALDLAVNGFDVTVLERHAAPGGKLREVAIGDCRIDAGPTVFTMANVFDAIFDNAGARLHDELTLHPAHLLARHAWPDGSRLDLFADSERSADAIADFAGAAEAHRYREFCRHAARVFNTLDGPFMRASEPTPQSLATARGLRGMVDLMRARPIATLWPALGDYFHDTRLRQLFARYATYTGSDPFQATATLVLVAHVEQSGVWRIAGGMARLAEALARVAERCGVVFRYEAEVESIAIERGRASGVQIAGGERLHADAVVCNADARAVAAGLFGQPATAAVAGIESQPASLSAVTWCLVGRTTGFDLAHHNVFFCDDYAAEFRDIFGHGRLPGEPTVYVCAQDRDDTGARTGCGDERLFCLANAPPLADEAAPTASDIAAYAARSFGVIERAGLTVTTDDAQIVTTSPADFARLFPGSRGSLYGQAAHGWRAPFARPQARSRVAGLYLAGGGVHPGAGLPMVALSGRHAARAISQDHRAQR